MSSLANSKLPTIRRRLDVAHMHSSPPKNYMAPSCSEDTADPYSDNTADSIPENTVIPPSLSSSSAHDIAASLRNLSSENLNHLVNGLTRFIPGWITPMICYCLRKFNTGELRSLVKRMVATISDPEFRRSVLNAIKDHIKNHPWQTAFLIIGIILMCNPLAMAGFGSLGPVAGSLAAAWQASIGGSVAAGSAFAVLQSMGMVLGLAIPLTGFGTVVLASISGLVGNPMKNWLRNWLKNWLENLWKP